MPDEGDGIADARSNDSRSDGCGRVENPGYGSGGRCCVLSKINDAPNESFYWAKVGVAAAGEPNDFSSNSVLLSGECERCKPSLPQLFDGGSLGVDPGRSNEELNVLELEWILVVVGIFTWSK